MTAEPDHLYGAFPQIFTVLRIQTGDDIYSAEFYPFSSPGIDPVFAVAYDRKIIVCRPSLEKRGIEVIKCFEDEDVNASLWSVAWSKDFQNGDPLLCVTGEPAKIKILNVVTGKLVKSLVGHGARINMILTSPTARHLLASASDDHTIRVWNLKDEYCNDPCRVLLAGWGHKAEVLSMSIHSTGRYLISAGNDTRVCLWVLPDISNVLNDPPSSKTKIVHYPHFVTEELHPYLVDCVAFHGDLVLSKCLTQTDATPSILLWRIVGFSSGKAPPPASCAPTSSSVTHETRSAFCSSSVHGSDAFQVLLSFSMPNVEHYCHSFGLYSRVNEHPVLLMGDSSHWISMWDLELIEQGLLGTAKLALPKKHPTASEQLVERDSDLFIRKSVIGSHINVGSGIQKQPFGGPFNPLRPHMAVHIPAKMFKYREKRIVRSFAWSVGGEWCVAVGDDGLICLMRWSQKEAIFKDVKT